ncbi:hypothetical protein NQ540_00340 [Granulicatella adiacens ATCC 49175]|nr:hypothetical protein [Granulicatella adiacens]UAK94543.1 hypothetical protein K8O88_04530 [Granulicatella adiacens]UWP38213.1 hypothetical protein NQ540_00340 [Granulicatella adiacens ATCC 49175]
MEQQKHQEQKTKEELKKQLIQLETTPLLEILKAKLGISGKFRDEYLKHLLKSVIDELCNQKGITLNPESYHHIDFIVDYAAFRYDNRDNNIIMPKHLQYRLNNLLLENLRGKDNVE